MGRNVLLSYNPVHSEESRIRRIRNNWVNHLSENSIEGLFSVHGLHWSLAGVIEHECIYLLRPAAS
jgi:hypothetical protein